MPAVLTERAGEADQPVHQRAPRETRRRGEWRCCAVRKLTRNVPYPQTRERPIAYDAGLPS